MAAIAGISAMAQSDPMKTRPLSLEEAIGMALQHNLDLQIERYNPQLSLYDLNAAYAGYDPLFNASGVHNFSRSGGGRDEQSRSIPASEVDDDTFAAELRGLTPWGMTYALQGNTTDRWGSTAVGTNLVDFRNTRGGVALRLSQPLLRNFWIDSTRLNIAVSKNRLKFTEQNLRRRIIDVVTAVEAAYYNLIFAQENVIVQRQALELAERLLAENRKRVEVGALAPLDEKQSESQVAARRADLLAAERTVGGQQNFLKRLITDDYGPLHDIVLNPTESLSAPRQFFNLQDSWMRGLNERPEMLQSRLDVERAGIQLRYYRNQMFPQLDVFGSYGHSGSVDDSSYHGTFSQIADGSRPFHSYGAQISIPLSNIGPRNRYRAGKVTVEQTVLALKALEQEIMVTIDDAIGEAQASYERVDATRQARLYAEAALDAEQKKLESGKSTSFFVLQFQRELTDARSREIRALADYNIALSRLAQAEGSTLERRGINVEIK